MSMSNLHLDHIFINTDIYIHMSMFTVIIGTEAMLKTFFITFVSPHLDLFHY